MNNAKSNTYNCFPPSDVVVKPSIKRHDPWPNETQPLQFESSESYRCRYIYRHFLLHRLRRALRNVCTLHYATYGKKPKELSTNQMPNIFAVLWFRSVGIQVICDDLIDASGVVVNEFCANHEWAFWGRNAPTSRTGDTDSSKSQLIQTRLGERGFHCLRMGSRQRSCRLTSDNLACTNELPS